MRTLIITEGGRSIGFGHITRCISLYQAFKKNDADPVLIVNGDKTAGEILAGYDCRVFNWLKDKQRLFDAVKGADIAVVDSYLADAGIYKGIANLVKAAVYLDDNMRIDYPKGVVVSGSVFAELMKYPKSAGVEYLLGSRYALMRKEFWNVPAKPVMAGIKSVMVTFGGTDGKNMTPKILRFLNACYPAAAKNVIVGAGFKNIREIERLRDENTSLIYSPDAKKMRAAMRKSDIAISAAGQTLYELARMGVPAITVCAADNQARNLEGWRKSGFVLYAGEHGDRKLFDRLSACMTKLASPAKRCKISILGQSLVDGEGAKRVAEKVIAEARKVRVLLTCVGGKFSLDTIEALKKSENPRIDVIGVDANENVAAKHVVKSFHVVPKGSEWPLKIMQIVEICKQEGVDIIIPCADEEAGAVATNRGLFEKNNIMCAVGNVSNAKLIVDKWKLFEFLSSNNVPMPKYYTIDNVGDLKDRAANFGYPKNKFVVKPRSSRGARGAFIVEKDDPYFSPEKIDYWDNLDLSDHIAMEYLPGPAYDVDVLAKKGEPIYVIPRRREWKNALSPSSEGCVVENNKRLISFVSRIVRVLKLHGVYDFDCGTTRGGNPALFEINPRFSGAVAASLGAGVNMPVMLVKMLLGVDIPKVKIDFGVHMRPLKKKVSFNNEKYRVHKMLFDKGKKKIYADKG